MFDDLSSKLHGIIRKVSGNATLTEDNIAEALKEIRRETIRTKGFIVFHIKINKK